LKKARGGSGVLFRKRLSMMLSNNTRVTKSFNMRNFWYATN
jgi:hypothetical protein